MCKVLFDATAHFTVWSALVVVASVLLAGIGFAGAASNNAAKDNADKTVDLRILIDVSGSMKRTDPDNLRVPALRLLIELMTDSVHAGVWTFGQHINTPVPWGQVNAAWKTRARDTLDKIHSRDLFTDIEAVLKSAGKDWEHPDPRYRRSMILLSDGVVDVSKDPEESAQSRQRILESILPRLRDAGAVIHTIALSNSADHELLKALAIATDGWYEQVQNADTLQRIFLRLFEKSAPGDTLPLHANRFQVDAQIQDMTLLIFHGKKKRPVGVISPQGKKYSLNHHPDNIKWHHEKGFDLVTVNKPYIGEWRLDTRQDPDNRVKVVTNLRLVVNDIPNNIVLDQQLTVNARMLQKDGQVREKMLLQRVKFSVSQKLAEGSPLSRPLLDDGRDPDVERGDAKFSAYLAKPSKEGTFEITILAEGPTFKRESHHSIRVLRMPAQAVIELAKSQEHYRITVTPAQDIEQLKIQSVEVRLPGSKQKPISVPRREGETWVLDLPAKNIGKSIWIAVRGRIGDDDTFDVQWQEVLPKVEPDQAKNADKQDKHDSEGTKVVQKKDDDTPIRWPLVAAIIMGVNGVLGLGGLGGYLFWRKRRDKNQAKEQEEVSL